jgi:hypothetical protein
MFISTPGRDESRPFNYALCPVILSPFDMPFDKLMILGKVEGLTALSTIEGEAKNPFPYFLGHG